MRALDYVRGRMAMLIGAGIAAAAAAAPSPMVASMSYPHTRQGRPRSWHRDHGFSGAKLSRRAADGTVGLARLK